MPIARGSLTQGMLEASHAIPHAASVENGHLGCPSAAVSVAVSNADDDTISANCVSTNLPQSSNHLESLFGGIECVGEFRSLASSRLVTPLHTHIPIAAGPGADLLWIADLEETCVRVPGHFPARQKMRVHEALPSGSLVTRKRGKRRDCRRRYQAELGNEGERGKRKERVFCRRAPW